MVQTCMAEITVYFIRHIEISESIPPTRPIVCLFERCSLNNTTDIIELKTIALPFTSGKNNWLGKSPESLRLIKFIANVQIPHIEPMHIIFRCETEESNFPLLRTKQKTLAQIKAINKKPALSSLWIEDWWIFCRIPIIPINRKASKLKKNQVPPILVELLFSNDKYRKNNNIHIITNFAKLNFSPQKIPERAGIIIDDVVNSNVRCIGPLVSANIL